MNDFLKHILHPFLFRLLNKLRKAWLLYYTFFTAGIAENNISSCLNRIPLVPTSCFHFLKKQLFQKSDFEFMIFGCYAISFNINLLNC